MKGAGSGGGGGVTLRHCLWSERRTGWEGSGGPPPPGQVKPDHVTRAFLQTGATVCRSHHRRGQEQEDQKTLKKGPDGFQEEERGPPAPRARPRLKPENVTRARTRTERRRSGTFQSHTRATLDLTRRRLDPECNAWKTILSGRPVMRLCPVGIRTRASTC